MKSRKPKIDEFSDVTGLEAGIKNLPKDKFEPFIRVLAGIVFLLSTLPSIYVVFSGDQSNLRQAFFINFLVGAPAMFFALRGNSGFAADRVFGRSVSPLWIWLAIFFTFAFFGVLILLYLFVFKH
jgi:hypothetical protein